MAMDLETTIYQAIWTALESNANWSTAFPPENRIRYDRVTGDESPLKPDLADGDYPQIHVQPPVSGYTSLFTNDETFATYAMGTPIVPWLEKQGYVFRLVITSQLLALQEISNLCLLTRNAIRLSGPRLGTPQVSSVKLSWRIQKVNSPGERGAAGAPDTYETVVRFQCEMDLAVECEVDGQSLE